MGLNPIGSCYYGDPAFTFPANTETAAYELRHVYDASRRTVKSTTHTITLRFTLTLSPGASGSLDSQADSVKQILSKPAQPFVYESKGTGALRVNAGTASRDVAWGPQPVVLSMEHVGAERSVRFTWQVQLSIPTCADAIFQGQLMEFVFRLTFDRDKSGYTTRRYTGFITIPQTRATPDSRTPTATADSYYEQILPAPLPGFRRVFGPAVVSEDGCRIDFDVLDTEEGPNYLPEGIVSADVSHVIRTSLDNGFTKWVGSFRGRYEMARDQSPETAVLAFLRFVQQRMNYLRSSTAVLTTENGKPISAIILPLAFQAEEMSVYGRPQGSFQFDYMFTQTRIADAIRRSGLWLPTDTSWDKWAYSLKDSALHPRGNAKLRDFPADHAFVDLCLSQGVRGPTGSASLTTFPGRAILETFCDPPPKPEDSWVAYESRLVVEDPHTTVVHTPLPTVQLQTVPVDGTQSGGYTTQSYLTQPDNKIQNRTGANLVVWLRGKALRAYYQIVPPQLTAIGEQQAYPANREDEDEGFQTWTYRDSPCLPIYIAKWNLRYVFKNVPGASSLTANRPTNFPALSSPLGSGGSTLTAEGKLNPLP